MAHKWTGKTDGSPFMQRALLSLMRRTDIRFIYSIMVVFYLPFYLISRPSAVRVQYKYFREHMLYSRTKAIRGVWCNFYNFGAYVNLKDVNTKSSVQIIRI